MLKSNVTIADTGERMVPAHHKGQLVYGEHIVRYEAVLPIVQNKVVLDIACGSGYGTQTIAQTAKKVYGVDVDQDAIAYAQANYAQANTEFILGSAIDIPLADNSVDVVVSFETLEHIDDYRKFMAEIKRVLKNDGLLVLSTPNDKEFPEGAHFHIHEFEEAELRSLVKESFANVKEYFQATWIYNALVTKQQMSTETRLDIPTVNTAPVGTDKALYFYMLCSNRKITEQVPTFAAISEHWSTRRMLEHNAKMDKYIKKTIKHYETIVAGKDQHIAQLNQQIAKTQAAEQACRQEVERIKRKLSWKLVHRLSPSKRPKNKRT